MYVTAQGCRLRNDLYCVEWDVKLYYTIPYHMDPILCIDTRCITLLGAASRHSIGAVMAVRPLWPMHC